MACEVGSVYACRDTHLNDRYTCPVDEGGIDYGKVVRILRGARYSGDLCLEKECLSKFPAAERGAILRREIGALRRTAELA
jgi:sugar phosphate isomerase/epimerase